MKITKQQLKELGKKVSISYPKENKNKVILPEKSSKEKQHISNVLFAVYIDKKIKYETEYKFLETRKFRFDWAIPSHKIAIEYEGIFSNKSRHTSLTGYTNDCEKYNLAVQNGWKVLRYTAKNYLDFEKDLKKMIL